MEMLIGFGLILLAIVCLIAVVAMLINPAISVGIEDFAARTKDAVKNLGE